MLMEELSRTWFASSGSRSRLYDAMLRQLANRYGYVPTLKTRFNQFARKRIRRSLDGHDPNDNLYEALVDSISRDTYKRPTLMRRALEDALVAGGPAALGYAVASGGDDG